MSPRYRVCPHPGCGTITNGRLCIEHSKLKRKDKDPEQRAFYGSAGWKKKSLEKRTRNPICEVCRDAFSVSVDHIDGNWRNNEDSNLRAVCTNCHDTKSGREHVAKSRRTR